MMTLTMILIIDEECGVPAREARRWQSCQLADGSNARMPFNATNATRELAGGGAGSQPGGHRIGGLGACALGAAIR
eukprot:COSAG03_NODE_637_length_6585_cov_2.441721_2_plen_76_part_00